MAINRITWNCGTCGDAEDWILERNNGAVLNLSESADDDLLAILALTIDSFDNQSVGMIPLIMRDASPTLSSRYPGADLLRPSVEARPIKSINISSYKLTCM